MTQSIKGLKSVALNAVLADTFSNIITPRVSQIVYPGDDTAASTAGGQTVVLFGSGFKTGASILINGSAVSVVTVISESEIRFTTPANPTGSYVIYVINTDGATGIVIPGIQYSGVPAWSTPAGSVGTIFETASFNNTLAATSDSNVSYSLASGTLPPGATLNANGTITGSSQSTASSTTYTFTVRATDAENQDTSRQFSITINPDVVTWSSPADNSIVTLSQNVTMSNVTLSATSSAGANITYSANTLPTGLSISGNTVSGTPTVTGNVSTLLTATSSTSRTATRTINWVVSIATDVNWINTTTLISSNAATLPFNDDASTNNFNVTINGDSRPNNFNPYTPGYYSNFFDGTGDWLTFTGPGTTFNNDNTSSMTIEFWAYATQSLLTAAGFFGYGTTTNGYSLIIDASRWVLKSADNSDRNVFVTNVTASTTPIVGRWQHYAIVFNSGLGYFYLDGTLVGSGTLAVSTLSSSTFSIGYGFSTSYPMAGHISNFRVVKGSALYSGTVVGTNYFTPSTAPLQPITGTVLLTCQSNRFIDNSTNNFAITRNGDVTITGFDPFIPDPTFASRGSTYFDGTGDFLSIASNAAFGFGTGDFTCECWIYPLSVTSSDRAIFDFRSAISSVATLFIDVTTSKLAIWTGTKYGSTGTTLVPNTWYHVAWVRASGTINVYLNGVLDFTTSATIDFGSARPLGIGAASYDASSPFFGYFSNYRIVKGTAVYTSNFTPPTSPLTAIANTSLLTCQTNQPVNNSVFLDSSTNNFNITRFGNTTQGTFSPYGAGWSNFFDGTGDYLTIPYNASVVQWWDTDYTIEMWVFNQVNAHSADSLPLQVAYGTPTTSTTYWSFGTNASGNLLFYYYNGGTVYSAVSTSTVPLNQWTHVAMVYTNSNSTLRGYINGTQVFSVSKAGTPQAPSGQTLNVGAVQNLGYNGYISNLRIVRGTAVYTTAFTPSTTPLQPIANTSLLTCADPRFIDDSANNFAITRNGDVSAQRFSPFTGTTLPTPTYSAYFDGSSDWLSFPLGTPLTLGTGNFTIEFWVNHSATAADTVYIGDFNQSSGSGAWSVGTFNGFHGSRQLYFIHSNLQFPITGISWNPTVGAWNHIAVVRNSNTLTIYVNGSSVGTGSLSADLGIGSGTCYISRASNDGTLYNLNGYISNARVVKGTALYTSNFTPSTSPLTAVSNTSLLTCQSNIVIDNSTNNLTITAGGNVRPSLFSPFTLTYSTKQSYSPSVIGGSMYFDGAGDRLTVADHSTFVFGNNNFTIECWVYLTNVPTEQVIFSKRAGTLTFSPIILGLKSVSGTNRIYILGSTSSGNWQINGSFNGGSIPIPTNTWTHLACVRNGTTVTGYVNGVADLVFTSISGSLITTSDAVTIGAGGTDGNLPFTGSISDLRVVNGTALYTSNFVPQNTPLQAIRNTTLLLNGTSAGIIDSTGMAVYETVGDAKEVTNIFRYGNTSMYFDGSGDGLLAPSSPTLSMGSGDFTIEFWYNPTSTAGTNPNIMCNNSGSGSFVSGRWSFHAPHSVHANKYSFWVASFSTSGALLVSTSNIATNTWTHVSVTRSGSSWRLFINGTLEATATHTGILDSGSNPLYIGHQPNVESGRFITGYISDLRITGGVARYTSSFTPPATAFIDK